MSAFIEVEGIGHSTNTRTLEFHVGDKPKEKYLGIKPTHIVSVQLDCDELQHAQDNLGAAKVNKRVVTYYGDEARRIFFNW